MKFTKLTVFAVLIAFFAISMWVTFQQEAFLTEVQATFLVFRTPSVPVIYYIAGAFITGLVIGVLIALNEHFSMAKKMKAMKKDFEAREQAYTAQLQGKKSETLDTLIADAEPKA